MKKFTILLLVIFGMCFSGQAFSMTVNISGTVTDISNGTPVPGHMVYIFSDSTNGFYYYNSVLTNSSGFYFVSITNVDPQDTVMFTVQTLDCANAWHSQVVSGNTTPITVNFQICQGTPPALTVTITGHVYEAGTVIPVPNHEVAIASDSSGGFYYYTTVVTDAAGFYSVMISNVPAATFFTVSTFDCNYSLQSQVVNGDNTPITVNFYICVGNPNPTGNMWGHIYAGNNLADYGRVDLILSVNDSLLVVDSYYINDSAGLYYFGNVPAGNYLLMAELLDNSAYYGQFLPTYYIESIYWNGATVIQQGATVNQYDIHLVDVSGYAPGSGNIQGNIQQGTRGSGTPVPDMEVLLLDQNNLPIAFTTTDINGNFSFPAISYGTYVIYPQKLAVNTTPATVTLTEGNPDADLSFIIENGLVYTGIASRQPSFLAGEVNIYPNPVMDKGFISLNASKNNEINVISYDMTGKQVMDIRANVTRGENRIGFSASSLGNGIYYMKVTSADGSSVTKKFVVGR